MDYNWSTKKRKISINEYHDNQKEDYDHRDDCHDGHDCHDCHDGQINKKNNNLKASESDASTRIDTSGNHIFFFGGVSKKSIYEINKQIERLNRNFRDLQQRNPQVEMTPKPIYLHINSYGGSVFAAFAGVDMIQQSKIPIYTIVEGATASAGTILSVVGKKRFMRPNASMLVHQLSSFFGGKMTEIDDEYQNLEEMMKSIKNIYLEHTNMTEEQLDAFLKHDIWWKLDTCIKKGLVDKVWEGND